MKIISWNVNGIRAIQKKGFLDWLNKESADVVCVQETKAQVEQLDMFLTSPNGYHTFWNSAERKGYSGVATFCKQKPLRVQNGLGIKKFDCEGRVLLTEFEDLTVLNIYFPNGKMNSERLKFKLDFYEATSAFMEKLKKSGKPVVTLGDYNTAHQEIDLARPKENSDVSGFLPIERAWLDKWVKSGQVDIFREFNQQPGQYTWWDMKTGARERNVGWRIDYHFVTKNLVSKIKSAGIQRDILGSDHCPIDVEIKL